MTGIDEMVCFALYTASRATTQAYRQVLQPWGLTFPQYLVIVSLFQDGGQTVGGLGERLMLDSGTLSPLLHRLESAGLVTRARRSSDERIVDVDLTERGREVGQEMRGVPEHVASCMDIAPDAARALIDSLHVLTRNVQCATEAPASE